MNERDNCTCDCCKNLPATSENDQNWYDLMAAVAVIIIIDVINLIVAALMFATGILK